MNNFSYLTIIDFINKKIQSKKQDKKSFYKLCSPNFSTLKTCCIQIIANRIIFLYITTEKKKKYNLKMNRVINYCQIYSATWHDQSGLWLA